MDVHLDFCEVAVSEAGKVSRVGRIASTPEAIREFAADLKGSDQVVLEASCGAMMIARLLAPRVGWEEWWCATPLRHGRFLTRG